MSVRFSLLAACWALATPILASAIGLTVLPVFPRPFEPAYARFSTFDCYDVFSSAKVEGMEANVITVRYETRTNVDPVVCITQFDVSLGTLPPGRYTVKATGNRGEASYVFHVLATAFSQADPVINYTGMWWDPESSGWGINIVQGPTNLIFATWFVYDEAGRPVWYTLQPGYWIDPHAYGGQVIRTSGPAYTTLGEGTLRPPTYDPSRVTETVVGKGTLSFFGKKNDEGRLLIEMDGVRTMRQIRRLPIE